MGRNFDVEDDPDDRDPGGEMTELEFRRPPAAKRRPPLTSDLEMPVLGDTIPTPSTPTGTLEAGAVLVSAAGSLLDRRDLPARPFAKDGGTMLMDAEGAAIARAVSRSFDDEKEIVVPDIMEHADIKKVLMGRPDAALDRKPTMPPPPPPMSSPSEPVSSANDLVFEESPEPDSSSEAALELAFNPRARSNASVSEPRPSVTVRPSSGLPMKPIVIALVLAALAAAVVRFADLVGR